MIEYGADTTRVIANLVFSGFTGQYPDITWVFSHSGGVMLFVIERFFQGGTSAEVVPGVVTKGQEKGLNELTHSMHGMKGGMGHGSETPKPGDPIFSRVTNVVVGSNVLAVKAAAAKAKALGYRVLVLSKSPASIVADLPVNLPGDRDQITTRGSAEFVELRTEIARLLHSKATPAERTPTADELAAEKFLASERAEAQESTRSQ